MCINYVIELRKLFIFIGSLGRLMLIIMPQMRKRTWGSFHTVVPARFSLLRSSIICLRGASSSCGPALQGPTLPIDLFSSEALGVH